MNMQDLFIDVQFNGMTRQVQILDTQPDEARYEQVIPLPATRANNILYETILYVDGIDRSVHNTIHARVPAFVCLPCMWCGSDVITATHPILWPVSS